MPHMTVHGSCMVPTAPTQAAGPLQQTQKGILLAVLVSIACFHLCGEHADGMEHEMTEQWEYTVDHHVDDSVVADLAKFRYMGTKELLFRAPLAFGRSRSLSTWHVMRNQKSPLQEVEEGVAQLCSLPLIQ